MNLLDLMEQPPAYSRARATDPDTSRLAAESMTADALGRQQFSVLWAMQQIDRHEHVGANAHDIAMRLSYTGRAPAENVIVKRCRELEDFALIRETDERKRGGSGRLQIVWEVTEAGRTLGADSAGVDSDD